MKLLRFDFGSSLVTLWSYEFDLLKLFCQLYYICISEIHLPVSAKSPVWWGVTGYFFGKGMSSLILGGYLHFTILLQFTVHRLSQIIIFQLIYPPSEQVSKMLLFFLNNLKIKITIIYKLISINKYIYTFSGLMVQRRLTIDWCIDFVIVYSVIFRI